MTTKAPPAQGTRTLIVSESAVRRHALRTLLAGDPDFAIIDAVDPRHLPSFEEADVIVADMDPDSAPLASILPPTWAGLVLLSDNPDASWTTSPLGQGGTAVLRRDCSRQQILAAVQAVAAGLIVLEPDIAERLLRPPLDTIALEPGEEELTERETEVLHMMTAGLTNREIASTLGISEHTVKFHIASIFGKLGTSTRTEAVTEGLRRGLILL